MLFFCLLFDVCCCLLVVSCLLLYVVRCALFVVRCVFFVILDLLSLVGVVCYVCCLSFAVCC